MSAETATRSLCIAGGILGALYPDTINQDWDHIVERVNGHDLAATASALSRLRQ